MTYKILLTVSFIVCYVVGLSGFIDSVKQSLWITFVKDRKYPGHLNLKPFDCPLCMVFWCCIISSITLKDFSIYTVAFSALLSLMAQNIILLLQVVRDIFGWLLYQIQRKL